MRAPSSLSSSVFLLLLLLLLSLGGPADRRVTGASAAPERSELEPVDGDPPHPSFRRSVAVTTTTTSSDDLPPSSSSSSSTSVPRNNDDGTSGNGDDLIGGNQGGAAVPGRNPNKDKAPSTTTTAITISVEPTPEPTPDASGEPTASPISTDALVGEPATDDYHHPLYDRNNRTTGAFIAAVSLLPFHVAYEPRFAGLEDVLASYRLLLEDGFRTAFSNITNVHNVSLWNVTHVLLRESSNNTTAATTVSGKVWFQTKSSGNSGGAVPDRDDVVHVQALILAAASRDHGATANADETAASTTTISSNPAAVAGTIGGLVGFVLGGVAVGLVVRFWIRRTMDSKRAASPQLPFSRSADEFGVAVKAPNSGGPPDRLVQFQFHAAKAAPEGSPPGSGTHKTSRRLFMLVSRGWILYSRVSLPFPFCFLLSSARRERRRRRRHHGRDRAGTPGRRSRSSGIGSYYDKRLRRQRGLRKDAGRPAAARPVAVHVERGGRLPDGRRGRRHVKQHHEQQQQQQQPSPSSSSSFGDPVGDASVSRTVAVVLLRQQLLPPVRVGEAPRAAQQQQHHRPIDPGRRRRHPGEPQRRGRLDGVPVVPAVPGAGPDDDGKPHVKSKSCRVLNKRSKNN
jgi:hypothetical protein